MIKYDKIEIKISSNNVNHYRSKGYECNIKDIITINVTDLMNQSTKKIIAVCDVCGSEQEIEYRKYVNNKKNKNFYVCSPSCAREKVKITNKEKYGDENYSNVEKRNKTCLEKYGDENYKNFEKTKKTNLEKYGFEYTIQNNDVKEKRQKTNIIKFNFDSPMKNDEIKIKRSNTMINRYGVKNYNNIEKSLFAIKNSNIEKLKLKFNVNVIDYKDKLFYIKCEKGHEYKATYDIISKRYLYNTDICTICNPIGVTYSNEEKKLSEFISENYSGEIILNNRSVIKPYELDIYLPELNLAFEYNGLYWHSELYKEKNYHKNKYKMCEINNIQLIQIWEDDWLNINDVVKSMILNKLVKTKTKIYARKCEIREIYDNILIKEFLNQNHIQGFVGSKIKIGLFYCNELVSLMTFSEKTKTKIYELNRFCNSLNTNVIGGASKLFNYFITNYKYDKIISFSNNSYSNGKLYEKLKFIKTTELKEDYSYIVNGIRIHKFNFRKKENQIETERELMLSKKCYRIYDAGKIKFTYPL